MKLGEKARIAPVSMTLVSMTLAAAILIHLGLTISLGRPSVATPLGVRLGFLQLLWILGQLAIFGFAVSRRISSDIRGSSLWVSAFIWASTAWITFGTVMSFAGLLQYRPMVIIGDLLGLSALLFWPRRAAPPTEGLSPGVGFVFVLLVVVARYAAPWGSGFGEWLVTPPTNPDTIEYYFYAFQNALHTGTIRIPFSYLERAAPYFPSGFMVVWSVFFLPLEGTDYLALWLQIPAIILSIVAFYSAMTSAGSSRNAAILACCVAASQRHLWIRQNLSYGGTDIWMLAYLASALALMFAAKERRSPWLWCTVGLAMGFASLMKVEGMTYSIGLLVPSIILAWPCRRSIVGLLMAFAFAGSYPYLRNLIFAGNPIFPKAVTILGVPLLAGDPDFHLEASYGPFSWQTPLEIFTNGVEFTQGATALFCAGWIAHLLIVIRRPRTTRIEEILLALLPPLLYGFYLLHPLQFTRRLYFPLMVAGVSFALFVSRVKLDEGIGDSMRRFVDELGLPAIPRRAIVAAATVIPAVAILMIALPLPGVMDRYQSEKLDRTAAMPSYYEDGILWRAVDLATLDRPDTVAIVGMTRIYPFAGRGLQNRVVALPRNSRDLPFDWGWGSDVVYPLDEIDTGTLMARIRVARIGIVVARRRSPEEILLRSVGAEILAESEAGTAFRVPNG